MAALPGGRGSSVQGSVGAGPAESVSSCDPAVLRLSRCGAPASAYNAESLPALPAELRMTLTTRVSWSRLCVSQSDEHSLQIVLDLTTLSERINLLKVIFEGWIL